MGSTNKYTGDGSQSHTSSPEGQPGLVERMVSVPLEVTWCTTCTDHGCFNHARFGILVSAHARYHDAVLPLGLFVEELYLCLEVILRNRTWRTLKVKVRKPFSIV